MFLPTFSRLDVAARCVYPWTSRQRWPKQPPNAFRGVGSAVSSVAECLAVWGDAPIDAIAEAQGLTPSDTTKLGQMAVHLRELIEDEATRTSWRVAEQALAYDLRAGTARELRQAHPRDYSDRKPHEMSGTPDLVFVRDGALVVRDYKTGRYTWGKNPAESRQLRALGLCAARAYGFHEVTLELVQVDADGVRARPEPLDAFELALCADELCGIHDRIAYEGERPPPNPGHWCDSAYCPLAATCPATTKALATVAKVSDLEYPLTDEITSPEHAAYLLERLAVAKTAIETIRHAVKEYAREHGPVPLNNDKLYGVVLHDGRERFDLSVDGALEAIRKHLGPFAAAAAVSSKTSKTAIEVAAKAEQTKRGQGVRRARALMDELRELGALKRGAPYETIEAFTPKG